MPNYRRVYLPGGIYFFTLVTYRANVELLRSAIAQIKAQKPFKILAAVVLPDHLHFVWQLPLNDSNYSQRISRFKVLFTRAFKANHPSSDQVSASRLKHRESDVWQRRFWEHTIKDEADLHQYLDYIHYNPVKHGLFSCPRLWQYSSFSKWVGQSRYAQDWGCICGGKSLNLLDFERISQQVGE